jgi:hypothetical protein
MNFPRRLFLHLATAGVMIVLVDQYGFAQTGAPTSRQVPARVLPVPTTVSPPIQKIVGAPISPTWNVFPKTTDEWKAQVDAVAAEAMAHGQWYRDSSAPETKETFEEIARFFDLHLGK